MKVGIGRGMVAGRLAVGVPSVGVLKISTVSLVRLAFPG